MISSFGRKREKKENVKDAAFNISLSLHTITLILKNYLFPSPSLIHSHRNFAVFQDIDVLNGIAWDSEKKRIFGKLSIQHC